MVNRETREKDILKLIKGLDIPQSLYEKAIGHYKAVATFLQEHGIESDIYPQGSYSLGTVVRPYNGDTQAAYDLDAICEINIEKGKTTPSEIKRMVGDALKSDKTYSDMLQPEWDKCWTLEYAEVNNIGFSVDVVPAVHEITESQESSIEDTTIAITNKKSNSYSWVVSNPKAYRDWFLKINQPFLEFQRARVKTNSRMVALNESSIEKISEEQERSALQRVIQIVKYHADVYYTKGRIKKYKSPSIIITTLITLLAQDVDPSIDVFGLLRYVVEQLEIYGENLVLNEEVFQSRYANKNIIQHKRGMWFLQNPLNTSENLVDSWNVEPQKAEFFFRWIRVLKEDFIHGLELEDEKFVAVLRNNFSLGYLEESVNMGIYQSIEPKPITNYSKPYRC